MEVGGEMVSARREDLAARLERLRRMEFARASVGGSAMMIMEDMAILEGKDGGNSLGMDMDSYMDVANVASSGPRGVEWIEAHILIF